MLTPEQPADPPPVDRVLADVAVPELPTLAAAKQWSGLLLGQGMAPDLVDRVQDKLRELLATDEALHRDALALLSLNGATPTRDSVRSLESAFVARMQGSPELQEQLRAEVSGVPAGHAAGSGKTRGTRSLKIGWRACGLYTLMLLGFVGVVVGPTAVPVLFTDESTRWTFLRIFAVILLAGFPAFLLVRFVFSRVGAMWEDFVLNLHRLGMDEPRYLPEPLFASVYYRPWYEDGGPALRWTANIYERKFQAAYGAIPRTTEASRMLALGNALPAYLATFVLAVLWTAVLWGAAPLDVSVRSLTTPGAVAFGFLGAYTFSVQMLIRRYFQADLRPIAYTGMLARLLFVLVVSYAIHQAFGAHWSSGTQAATLFLVGFFPSTALQVLRVGVAKALRSVRLPNMASDYPLSDLDGMNVWYEARLLEVGIEDMQNLATANLVDVLLGTRVPVARLVDWIDQAVLFLSMAPVRPAREPTDAAGPPTAQGRRSAAEAARYRLRAHGIRTATDVENQFRTPDPRHLGGLSGLLSCTDGVSVLEAIRTGIANEPNLAHVRNWKRAEHG